MLVLSFDTCFNKTYIVLRRGNEILANEVISSTEKEYHSVFLIPKIRDILQANNLLIKDLSAISVNIGPGSFTGIRASITIARVLCQQANIKLIGVPSLQILSYLNKSDKITNVILDARKNKVYFGKYLNGKILQEPKLIEIDNILAEIEEDSIVVSDTKMSEILQEKQINSIVYEQNDGELGLYLSSISYDMLLNSSDDFNWAKVKPLYIQPPSITKSKECKNVL